jgi:hypothetical protein
VSVLTLKLREEALIRSRRDAQLRRDWIAWAREFAPEDLADALAEVDFAGYDHPTAMELRRWIEEASR